MKKVIAQLAAAQGLEARYQGSKRRMFLVGKGARRISSELRTQFPNLEFTLVDQAK